MNTQVDEGLTTVGDTGWSPSSSCSKPSIVAYMLDALDVHPGHSVLEIKASTLDIPLHLRIDRALDEQLRQRAAAEHIPTSALVRRLLRRAVHGDSSAGLTAVEVEDIAREELHRR